MQLVVADLGAPERDLGPAEDAEEGLTAIPNGPNLCETSERTVVLAEDTDEGSTVVNGYKVLRKTSEKQLESTDLTLARAIAEGKRKVEVDRKHRGG